MSRYWKKVNGLDFEFELLREPEKVFLVRTENVFFIMTPEEPNKWKIAEAIPGWIRELEPELKKADEEFYCE